MRALGKIVLTLGWLGTCGCGAPGESGSDAPSARERMHADAAGLAQRDEHDVERVVVQHVLVGVRSERMSSIERSPEQAEALAARIFERALAGEEFEILIREYSDDTGPGTYAMTMGEPYSITYPRTTMVPGFGDVAWRLDVGEIGVAAYDARTSPLGWHVIKRLE